jgi:Site-specific recombinases, DNA invertase Pin homologs
MNNITMRIYVRASTKDQDAKRALDDLVNFSKKYSEFYVPYIENFSGTKLERPELNRLLEESKPADILLIESVDRLSRLSQDDFEILKSRINDKGLRLIVADIPTTHIDNSGGGIGDILNIVNSLLINLLATMSKLDNEKRRERIKQGMQRSGYKPKGKKPNIKNHNRVKQLLILGGISKEEIAKAVGVSVATVYRIKSKYNIN